MLPASTPPPCSAPAVLPPSPWAQVLSQMNARRQADAEELDVEGLLGQLTNVNKVHVACEGLSTDVAAAAAAGTRCGGTLAG